MELRFFRTYAYSRQTHTVPLQMYIYNYAFANLDHRSVLSEAGQGISSVTARPVLRLSQCVIHAHPWRPLPRRSTWHEYLRQKRVLG